MSKLIGLSLSMCVSAIINGQVNEDDVERIIAATKIQTEDDFNQVIAEYRTRYWSADPDRGEAIARRLVLEMRLDQPRLLQREPHPGLADGIWQNVMPFHTGDEVTWHDPDDGLCSHTGVILTVEEIGDDAYRVVFQDGYEIEAFAREFLSPAPETANP